MLFRKENESKRFLLNFILGHHYIFKTRCYHHFNFYYYNQPWPKGVMTPLGQITESTNFLIFQVKKN